ncbi:hypothetical protein L3Q82_025446, partial [Scortum barcoo]
WTSALLRDKLSQLSVSDFTCKWITDLCVNISCIFSPLPSSPYTSSCTSSQQSIKLLEFMHPEDRARSRLKRESERERGGERERERVVKMMATDAEEIRNQSSPCPVPDNSLSTLSIKITRKNQDRQWKLRFIYLQCYFLTIATILGTGILGLPVTIAHAGLVPFLVSFLIGFFVQALLIYLFVELLQKCQVVQLESLKPPQRKRMMTDESESAEADTGLLQPDAAALHNQAENLQPNLHMLGLLFLSRPMSHAFNCILLFQFITIGISYVLAGSEAYAALLNVSHIYVIPAFTWILTLGILLAHTVIQPITSLLTLLKGILLIVTVAVTFAVGSEVGLQSSSDFSQMGKPFLMGTVALGGIVNVMPLLFSQISHNKTQVLYPARILHLWTHCAEFRKGSRGTILLFSCIGTLTQIEYPVVSESCAWRSDNLHCAQHPLPTHHILKAVFHGKAMLYNGRCWAVLEIVPQTSLPERQTAAETTTQPDSSSLPAPHSSTSPPLFSNISLEESEKAGEIATIPLTKVRLHAPRVGKKNGKKELEDVLKHKNMPPFFLVVSSFLTSTNIHHPPHQPMQIINERYRAYSWVAELIQVFIAISVTVSFLVMGSAMKHTIDGLVSSSWSSRLEWLSKAWERNLPNKQHVCSARSMAKGFMSLLGFGVIFIVSVCDPRGFVVILDKVVSFSLNTEVGLFVFIMLRESREDRYQNLAVPLPVGDCVFSLSWLLPTYFLFAVTYDVLQTLADVAHYLPFYSHGQEAYNRSLTESLTAANLSILL